MTALKLTITIVLFAQSADTGPRLLFTWRAQQVSSRIGIPADHNQLVKLVLDPGTPGSLVNRAWTNLIPIIKEVARLVAMRHGPEYELDGAVAFIWEKLQDRKYDPAKGDFIAWCNTVLSRATIDSIRAQARRPDTSPTLDNLPDSLSNNDDNEDAGIQLVREMRSCLNNIADQLHQASHRVNFFAVILLQLRIAMARRAGTVARKHDYQLFHSFIEFCIPWTSEESNLRIRPELPTLAQVWLEIAPLIDNQPHFVTGTQVCDLINKLANHHTSLRHSTSPNLVTPSQWLQWVSRAKNAARKLVDDHTWNRVFAHLLPIR